MVYTIYLRTNLINGKQYVGQSGDFETREKQFKRINQRYANKILSKDRRKFGLDNFKLEILAGVCQSAIVYAVLYSKKHISKGYKWSYEPL